jgi:Tol biopolymer transport system component
MNGDGSEPRRLTDNETPDLGAVWSPNGKTVAFFSIDELVGPHIFLVSADGGFNQTPLTEMRSRFPSWSASGKIAFDNGGPNAGDIFVINPDGSGLEQLTNAPGRAEHLSGLVAQRPKDRVHEQARRQRRDLRHERKRNRPDPTH